MKAYNWDFKKALDYVQQKRNCIKPNASFISQLETYQVHIWIVNIQIVVFKQLHSSYNAKKCFIKPLIFIE